MRAVAYTRVSLEEMVERGLSLEMQAAQARRYATDKSMDLLGVITDPGCSGKDLNREGIQEIIRLVVGRKVQAVIVYREDRLTRSVADALNIAELFTRKKVSLHSVVANDEVDTVTADGEFVYGLHALLSQRERRLIGERTRAAMNVKRERGERISRFAPFGYRFAGNKVVNDKQEQDIIGLARRLSEGGMSVRGIAAELKARGVVGRGNRPLGKSQVHRILSA